MTGSSLRLQCHRTSLERLKGRREQVILDLEENKRKQQGLKEQNERVEQAQVIIQHVAQDTQKQIRYRLSELVSLALATVLPDPYEMDIRMPVRRGRTEVDLLFQRDGHTVEPIGASGGTAVDVAAFGLRVSLWSLAKEHCRPVLVLDEPFGNSAADLLGRAASLLSETAGMGDGLQLIIASHDDDIIETGATVFRVSKEGQESQVVKETG